MQHPPSYMSRFSTWWQAVDLVLARRAQPPLTYEEARWWFDAEVEPEDIPAALGIKPTPPARRTGLSAGDRLREARKKHFSSAAKAAKFFRMTPSTYTAHENGQNAFNIDQCAMYAKKYNVSPTWLAWGLEASDDEAAA